MSEAEVALIRAVNAAFNSCRYEEMPAAFAPAAIRDRAPGGVPAGAREAAGAGPAEHAPPDG